MNRMQGFLVATIFFCCPAMAAIYDFNYTMQSSEVLSGRLVGERQAGGDFITVSNIVSASYTGLRGTPLPTNLLPGFGSENWVTLSGSSMNLIAGILPVRITDDITWALEDFESSTALVGYPFGGVYDLETFRAESSEIREVPLSGRRLVNAIRSRLSAFRKAGSAGGGAKLTDYTSQVSVPG